MTFIMFNQQSDKGKVRPQFRLRLVSEGILWLWLCLGMTATLAQPVQANRALPTDLSYSTETTWLLPGLPDLTVTAGTIPHNFSQNELPQPGFRAGKAYPEMTIQDLAWSLETLPFYYPAEYLQGPIEAFIGQANVDETTSLIHTTYLYYNLAYDTAWLQHEIAGIPIIEHLNTVAEQLYDTRLDPQYGLLRQGPTSSWGLSTDRDTITTQPRASLYDQAVAYMALIELATMNAALGNTGQADEWQQRAEALKIQSNAYLWQAEGFYRPYLLLAPDQTLEHPHQVSIVNALAVYSGLTHFQQSQTIFEQLERVRLEADVSKPGLSIYPYYTASEFAALYGPSDIAAGDGLNGGVWDWWGGLQIKAEFLNGFAEAGQTHLLQVVREWQKHPGNIIEWQSTTNSGQEGSHYHTAAAGMVGSAIIEGFFGVQLNGDGLHLQPRLGLNDGFIRVYQPATDRYVAYSYDWDQNYLTLSYGTNAGGPVNIKVLQRPSEHIREVHLDDHPIPFETEIIGNDRYTVFTGPSGQHYIQILKGSPLFEERDFPSDRDFPSGKGLLETAPQEKPSLSGDSTPLATKPNIAPNLTSHQGLLSVTQQSLIPTMPNEVSKAIAAKNVRQTWTAFLYLVSSSWIVVTSLIVILLVAIRRLAGLRSRFK